MAIMKALVLAAGRSTRIAAVSAGRPKPLLEIAGESILGRNLGWLSEFGVHDVWINLHHQPHEIQQAIDDGTRFGVRVRYSLEDELLGTAGAVQNLAEVWDETLLVVYGDNLVRFNLDELLQFHRSKGNAVSIAVFHRTRNLNTGIAGGRVRISTDNRIEDFREGANDDFSPFVNAGVYVIQRDVVSQIPSKRPCDFARDVFPQLLAENVALYGYPIDGFCLGIDNPESYYRAIEFIENGKVVLS